MDEAGSDKQIASAVSEINVSYANTTIGTNTADSAQLKHRIVHCEVVKVGGVYDFTSSIDVWGSKWIADLVALKERKTIESSMTQIEALVNPGIFGFIYESFALLTLCHGTLAK